MSGSGTYLARPGWLARRRQVLVLCLAAALSVAACGSLSQSEAPRSEAPRLPEWTTEEVRNHLRVFNGALRTSGETGDTTSAGTVEAYVASRLAGFRLQPALASSFRVPFAWSQHRLRHAAIQRAGATDTTSVARLGDEMIPDGRSAGGGALVRSVRVGGQQATVGVPGAVPPQQAVLLNPAAATTKTLEAWASAGARTVFLVGPLEAVRAARPAVSGLLVLRLTPSAASRLVGRSTSGLLRLLRNEANVGRTWTVPEMLVVQVAAETDTATPATNVMGFIPGKHPVEQRELVIVMCELASVRTMMGLDIVNPQRLGAGAAATLDAASHLAALARYWPAPERTVLFAFWSSEVGAMGGLRTYLRDPVWPLDQTNAVLFVGPSGPDLDRAKTLLAPHGIPVYGVALATDTLGPDTDLLVRDGSVVGRDTVALAETPSNLWRLAVPAALEGARATYGLLLRETVTPELILPVRPDSLAMPPASRLLR